LKGQPGSDSTDVEAYGREVLFNEASSGKWFPRSIMIDCDSEALDNIMCGEFGGFFNPDSYLSAG